MKRIAIVFALIMASTVSATTIHVPTDQPTIQAGIDAAVNGDTVLVASGTYVENVSISGKAVYLIASPDNDTTYFGTDTLSQPALAIAGRLADGTVVEGFNFTSGGSYRLYISNVVGTVIKNNTFTGYGELLISDSSFATVSGNTFHHIASRSVWIFDYASVLLIKNLFYQNAVICIDFIGQSVGTVENNTFDGNERSITNSGGGAVVAKNNIFTNATNYAVYGIYAEFDYNDLWNNPNDYVSGAMAGPHDISLDPKYSNPTIADYSLVSNSPCIDAGDPDPQYNDPDGTRNDMGAFPFQNYGKIVHVSPAGDDSTGDGSEQAPFQTVQHAINSALVGDTVLIHDGHYYERISFLGKSIVVSSKYLLDGDTSHISTTVLDGDTTVLGKADTGSVVRFVNGEDSTTQLIGLTITKGAPNLNGFGGGIFIHIASPTITNCRISNNIGSGIFYEACTAALIDGCRIDSNLAVGVRCRESEITILSSIIEGNSLGVYSERRNGFVATNMIGCIVKDNGGDGVYVDGGQFDSCTFTRNGGTGFVLTTPTVNKSMTIKRNKSPANIRDCSFTNNGQHGLRVTDWLNYVSAIRSTFEGNAGAGVQVDQESEAYFDSCIFLFNGDSTSDGGGIRTVDPDWEGVIISARDCIFANNVAAKGGAVYANVHAYQTTLERCLFLDNEARVGGALYNAYKGRLTVTNCTFVSNYADTGSAIHFDINGPSVDWNKDITGSVLAFNYGGEAFSLVGQDPDTFLTIRCTDLFGNEGGDWSNSVVDWADTNGNFSTDPRFCDTANGDYTLAANSPCAPANNACSTFIGALPVGCDTITKTWYVDITGSDSLGDGSQVYPFASISHAVESAASGDTIIVGAGTFTDWIQIQNKSVHVMSKYGPDSTVLSGSQSRIFEIEGLIEHSISVNGFTFDSICCGVASMYGSCSVGIYNNVFQHSTARGPLLFPWDSVYLEVVGNLFRDVYVDNTECILFARDSRGIVQNNTFDSFGIAILVDASTATRLVTENIFSRSRFYVLWGPVTEASCNLFWMNYDTHAGWAFDSASNFFADPLFCDTADGDFTIKDSAPCAPGNNSCGVLIGAYGVGCVNVAPDVTSADTVTAIEDTPFVYIVTVDDVDGPDTLISFESLPSWLTAVADSVYGTPLTGFVDTSFTAIASDGFLADTQQVYIHVQLTTPIVDNVWIVGVDTALHVTTLTPVVEWMPFDPLDLKAQSQYEIAFGTDNDWAFAEMWNPAPVASSDTFVTYAGAVLVDGETYWLRLRVHNGVKWSDWYEESFRMNSVPSAPIALSPLENDIIGQSPTLWVQNAVDAEGDLLTYDYTGFHDTDCVFGGPIDTLGVPEGIDSTGVQVGTVVPLGENCIYWWSARAFDGYEYSTGSVTQMFFIDATPESPTAFMCVYPPDTGNMPVFEMMPTFDWGRSYDGDPLDTVRYDIEVAIDSAFLFKFSQDSLLGTSYAFPDSVEFGTHYWWRVTAFDKTNNRVASTNQPDFWTWELGDLDHSHTVDIADLTRLVDFMFKFGPELCPAFVGDMDGSCSVDIADLTYLVAYMFKNGPAPQVGCE